MEYSEEALPLNNAISPENRQNVFVRSHPYPYCAMLSICSDLDETPDKTAYFETLRYLNTSENTVMGPGVDLEVGNTIYFDMPEDQFSYWGTDDAGRKNVRECIKSGHIDCIHSFGDLADTRGHAEKALKELADFGCKLDVWIDHAIAPTNLGKDIMKGMGDIPGSEPYHADLSFQYGIRYIWCGRVTSIVGQNVPRNLFRIWTISHPLASFKTFLKELVKVVIAKLGNIKYGFHATNNLIRTVRLSGGQSVSEFMRCNPYWGGIEKSETAEGLADVLTKPMLASLIASEGFSIIYTHLGKVKDKTRLFSERTKESLQYLSTVSKKDKKILVTTTRRMLGYANMLQSARITSEVTGSTLTINIDYAGPNVDVAGLTLYVGDYESIVVTINGDKVDSLEHNPSDHTGRASVTIPWKALEFPKLDNIQ